MLRYLHANGASMFFLVVYIHMGRVCFITLSFFQDSCFDVQRNNFCLNDCYSFFRLCFTMSQMSFWAATVITNLITAIPVFGTSIVEWLWGGFALNNATLNRFTACIIFSLLLF